MNIVEIIGIVIFCGVLLLALVAVFDILFTPASEKGKRRPGLLKRMTAFLARNKSTAADQRREHSTRH
jgi:type II secretory pathway component PulM